MTEQRRTIAFNWYADQHERFAEDVKLPEPGSPVRFQGRETVLVSASRIDDTTVRLEVEVPDGLGDLVGKVFPFESARGKEGE